MAIWLKFPKTSNGISIDQLNFKPEFEDSDGRLWFRAPDHIATKILNMGLKFEGLASGEKPEGCDESQLGAVIDSGPASQDADLSIKIAQLQRENADLRDALTRLSQEHNNAEAECAGLRQRVKELEEQQQPQTFSSIQPSEELKTKK